MTTASEGGPRGVLDKARRRIRTATRRARMAMRRKPAENVAYNRELWDTYASTWDAATIGADEWTERSGGGRASYAVLGEEWGLIEDVGWIVADCIDPYIKSESVVAEIGSGGGRFTLQVAPKVAEVWCFDISKQMLRKLEVATRHLGNVRLHQLDDTRLSAGDGTFDFVYSFAVFVHLDLHTIWKYFQEIARVLKPGGHASLQVADLTKPLGWKRFASQDTYKPETHYFVSPQMIRALASHAGLDLVVEHEPDPERFHTNETLFFVLRKPG